MSATNISNQPNFNLVAVLQATVEISREVNVDRLISLSLKVILNISESQLGAVILVDREELPSMATLAERSPNREIIQHLPIDCANPTSLPLMVREALRDRMETHWSQKQPSAHFACDPYWREHPPQAALCIPLWESGNLLGAIYLEDYDRENLYQPELCQVLRSLCQQVAISLWRSHQLTSIDQGREIEEALQRSNSLLKSQREASVDGVLAVDEQGRIVSYNNRFCQLWQIPEAVLQSVEYGGLLSLLQHHLQLPEGLVEALENAYDSTEIYTQQEIYLANDRVFDCYSGQVHSPEGKFYGMVWYFRDVTERIRIQQELQAERDRSESLLLNMLPEGIAKKLKHSRASMADGFEEVSVLFADIVGFTELSSNMSPTEVVGLLNRIFSIFDNLCDRHKLEKIKTIGDAYMVVSGLPQPRGDHAIAIANMALDMQKAIAHIKSRDGVQIAMRIGINSGPVVAGVIGTKKFIYDLWGDTVNVASRMESLGTANAIQVTESTYIRIREQFNCEKRGIIMVKGKGEMMTYWLNSRKEINTKLKIA
ncbi:MULTISPECIES: adenylate/guanylate cyclase domain-containing protein [Pseudanabaena]|uniref:Adenylate cyclase n=2 Tax=Pseudanabaena TaxID=1152 RepID=L8MS80_9CYAN|nr:MULTISPECIES: adenylate/guanylate cyclase domain-containing protein [Pseudanabaena]ELS30752.1 adenylate/guanylate cyclase with GAF sensor(s) [Pseudanabaena biceps PCC 7429]MDG3496980.1 adenylate/guanylate cyclase domain-containing protein [Pseudanabaena catenata USMAC16]